jgi:hypothetical protein
MLSCPHKASYFPLGAFSVATESEIILKHFVSLVNLFDIDQNGLNRYNHLVNINIPG